MTSPPAGHRDDTVLTPRRVLDATEDVLRRFGPAKANVADVARALEVSPGSVYRHFPSKAALREAVTRRWLERIHVGLGDIADGEGPAGERLGRWLTTLFEAKRRNAVEEPGLFETYVTLVSELGFVEVEHLADLKGQLARIVASGVERGEFRVGDSDAAAATVLSCTARFNHPLLAREWRDPTIDAELAAAVALIVAGLANPGQPRGG